ncbi:MAG: hypothetical protein U9N55_02395 [candidate division Zixibacteria bacterium]|nr:hypothetical protein [candidate division Zixibacteria bacterium]
MKNTVRKIILRLTREIRHPSIIIVPLLYCCPSIIVIPADAGIHRRYLSIYIDEYWIPAFAGMTNPLGAQV